MTLPLSLTVNGRPVEAVVEPRMHLADFLRDVLRLTGTHLGCEHGVCGACTVLIDGAPARSCIAYAISCDGADVRTIEGFDHDPLMRALRRSFTRHHALQCGYCTPGMLITSHDIVRRLPEADEARVREELSGNLCRCTGYVGIVEAVGAVLAEPPARADGTPGPAADPSAPSTTAASDQRRQGRIATRRHGSPAPASRRGTRRHPCRTRRVASTQPHRRHEARPACGRCRTRRIRTGRTGLPSPIHLPGCRHAMRPAGRTPSDPSTRWPLQSHRSRYGTFSGTSRPWCAVFRGRRLRAPRTPTLWLSK